VLNTSLHLVKFKLILSRIFHGGPWIIVHVFP